MRQPLYANFNEVVEDSEPEREERRQKEKEARRIKKAAGKAETTVLELSDSDEPGVGSPVRKNQGVYFEQPSLGKASLTSNSGDSEDEQRPSAMCSLSNVIERKIVQDKNTPTDSDEDVDERTLGLRRKVSSFAFPTTFRSVSSSSNLSQSSLRIDVRQTSDGPAPQLQLRKPSGHRVVSYWSLTESQLKLIMKCVSCDRKWTTRKTVAHKVTHIKSCAKKNRLTDETISILLSREVAATTDVSQSSGPSSSKAKAPMQEKDTNVDQPSIDPTFLDHVVQVAQPVRQGKRRKDAPDLLRTASDARADIRQRAYMLLSHSSSGNPPSSKSNMPPPLTIQVTGRSKLAAHPMSLLRDDSPASDQEPPPLTQAFTGSKLGLKHGDRVLLRNEMEVVSEFLNDEDAPHEKPVPKEINPKEGSEPEPALCVDEVLHFDPEEGLERDLHRDDFRPAFRAGIDNLKSGKPNLIQTVSKKHTSNDELVSPSRKAHTQREEASTTPRRKRKGKGREDIDTTDTNKNPMTDEEVFDRLKGLILADKPLYMRVLRYEPIHFDVFLEVATQNSIHAGALRSKVKAFLDKQAIHYYGSEPGGGRNRR